MTTFDICVKIPQLIDSLYKNVFFQINKKIDSDVGDMTFQIPDGPLLWNLYSLPGGNLEIYLCGTSFLYHFLECSFSTECNYITLQCVCKHSSHGFNWTKQHYFICSTLSPWYGILSLQNDHPAEISLFYQ